MAPKAQPLAAATSKDRGQLSIQIDTCADALPDLMTATRKQANDARAAGALDTADRLDDLSVSYAAQYGTMIRHEIKEIDDSDAMRNAIKGFATLTGDINRIVQQVKDLTEFLKQATAVAKALDKLIAVALKAAP